MPRLTNKWAKPADLPQDGIGRGHPDERSRLAIVPLDELVDPLHRFVVPIEPFAA